MQQAQGRLQLVQALVYLRQALRHIRIGRMDLAAMHVLRGHLLRLDHRGNLRARVHGRRHGPGCLRG
jgi:hypothetical protein